MRNVDTLSVKPTKVGVDGRNDEMRWSAMSPAGANVALAVSTKNSSNVNTADVKVDEEMGRRTFATAYLPSPHAARAGGKYATTPRQDVGERSRDDCALMSNWRFPVLSRMETRG